MTGLLWNVLLALVWAAVTGSFAAGNLALGFGLGFLVLIFTQRITGTREYAHKARQVLGLGVFFVWELILANLRVAYDVMTPRHRMRPGVIAVPLSVTTDIQITLLANLITLTPGSVCLDVSTDRRVLYVHALHIDDVDAYRQRIKNGFERRILEVLG